MPLPVYFVVCSYNIWSTYRWPERRDALKAFAQHHIPDILCLQELQADSRQALDEVLLATHQRVDDPFEGWTREGNIYWNMQLFDLVEYGDADIGILEKYRRLFWVRLQVKDGTQRTLLVSTAHYTWSGHVEAITSEKNVRIPQARATVKALADLRRNDEPQLFMGDLNDNDYPIQLLHEGGLVDCFAALGRVSRSTWPAMPTAMGAPTTIDWMMHVGNLKPKTAEVVDYYHADMAPSDHKPVLATYAF
jgi:endonuclease/exonuclease/phosphatase family metal-dependent hydrolase